jgi:hypothetical protein
VNLFPERADRGNRWLLPLALVLSIAIHFGVGPAVRWWWPRLDAMVARVVPHPTPTPEIVALSDAITIEKRTVPREVHRAPRPQRRAQSQPRPRAIAQAPAPQSIPIPTLPPVPTAQPTARATVEPTIEPTHRPVHGTIHHPRAQPMPDLRPRPEPTVQPTPSSRSGYSPQQLAALDAQFSKTIAQAQHSLTDVPPQHRPPARMPNQMRYEAIMAGTPEMFINGQADCNSIQEGTSGALNYYYLRCFIQYSDGYFEEVSLPWAHYFPRRNDPIDMQRHDGIRRSWLMHPPPAGFVLPPHFALSRAVCTFYRAQCQNIIDRERANGNQPATDVPK